MRRRIPPAPFLYRPPPLRRAGPRRQPRGAASPRTRGAGRRDLTAGHIASILALAQSADPSAQLSLPARMRLADYGNLCFSAAPPPESTFPPRGCPPRRRHPPRRTLPRTCHPLQKNCRNAKFGWRFLPAV
jgi:hypothetical protein